MIRFRNSSKFRKIKSLDFDDVKSNEYEFLNIKTNKIASYDCKNCDVRILKHFIRKLFRLDHDDNMFFIRFANSFTTYNHRDSDCQNRQWEFSQQFQRT